MTDSPVDRAVAPTCCCVIGVNPRCEIHGSRAEAPAPIKAIAWCREIARLCAGTRTGDSASFVGDLIEQQATALQAAERERDVWNTLDAIAHGDDEHRAWLRQAIDDHRNGRSVEYPRGKGRVEALEQQLATAWAALSQVESTLGAFVDSGADAATVRTAYWIARNAADLINTLCRDHL